MAEAGNPPASSLMEDLKTLATYQRQWIGCTDYQNKSPHLAHVSQHEWEFIQQHSHRSTLATDIDMYNLWECQNMHELFHVHESEIHLVMHDQLYMNAD